MQHSRRDRYRELRLILGDQLNLQHSWYATTDDSVLYLVAELKQETDYVTHHVQKLCAFFAAMELFARELRAKGHQVLYLTLDETSQYSSLPDLIAQLCQEYQVSTFAYQRPDEYRLLQQLKQLSLGGSVQLLEADTEHFLLAFDELPQYFASKKRRTMESFYRSMRRRFAVLMKQDKPEGGKWNFDIQNRQKLSAEALAELPEPLLFSYDVQAILRRINHHGINHFGAIRTRLTWPLDRAQSLQLLEYFIAHALPRFGYYQDAMTAQTEFSWSLYHSRLSFALNTKILHPREVIDAAVTAYRANGDIDISQVEGFVRQILGWREYIRGVYWTHMPDYASMNHFNARRALPEFFWNGKTKMRCMQQSLQSSLTFAYAHHIQRLMVIGNFCLLAGVDPDQVDAWFLGVYLDAIQWVELPNTRGMALYGDGGLVATKPYAAGGNYINKMSDYCSDCHYQVKQKTGTLACPFNSLYWHFMHEHRAELEKNHRCRMIYSSWDRMEPEDRQSILAQASTYLNDIAKL